MKQFLKFTFASVLGFVIGGLILIFLLFSIIGGLIASSSKEEARELKTNSVLELKLDYLIQERTSKNPFEALSKGGLNNGSSSGLDEIIKAIKVAGDKEQVKGIYLHVGIVPADYATLEAIRNELIAFKKKKKFIIAYGEILEEHSYYVASVADAIYLNPAGELLIDGFSSSTPYLKGMFDKVGLEPQLIRHGKYKAAGEPLIAKSMSAENRQQIEAYLGSMYNNWLTDVAGSRKIDVNTLREIANQLKVQSPEDAKNYKLINDIFFEDQVHEVLMKKVGVTKMEDIQMISTAQLAKHYSGAPFSTKDKIAVIYCVGDIVSGEGDEETMGSETIASSLRKAKNDSAIKAVVLRINSPGGSALASDVIWREVMLTKAVKPVIVSMGTVAASGGYYIAAPADVIVAEKNSVTGSIGVFALLMNANELIENKLGINIETVKFGEFADMGSPERGLTQAEKVVIQKYIDRIYDDFITKVADGRKLSKETVDSLAQGRVWSGTDAKRLGLIDEFGGLEKAIEIAAKKAKTTEYRMVTYPEQKDPIEQIVKSLSGEASVWMMKQQLGAQYDWYAQINKLLKYQGVQLRYTLPINIE